jgi:hypothetical protein
MASPALSPSTAAKPEESAAKAEAENQKQILQVRVNDLLRQETPLHASEVKSILAYSKFVKNVHDELKGKDIKSLRYHPWHEFVANSKGGKSTVSKCLAIADHECINDPAYQEVLPNSRASLYELCALNKTQFKRAVKDGKINTQLGYTEAHKLCLDLKAIQPAPEGKRLVRVEGENGKNLVTNQPPKEEEDMAEDEAEEEDEPGISAAATVRSTKRIAPLKDNSAFDIEQEVQENYSSKLLEEVRDQMLAVLITKGLTRVGIRLVSRPSTRPVSKQMRG